jgi:hypothetical protein
MEADDRMTPENTTGNPSDKELGGLLVQDCGPVSGLTRGPGGFFFEGGSPPFNTFGI